MRDRIKRSLYLQPHSKVTRREFVTFLNKENLVREKFIKMKDLGIVENWTCEGVSAWLESQDLGEYCELLSKIHKIDGKALLSLTEEDLRTPPVCISILGDVKRLIRAIEELKREKNPLDSASGTSDCSVGSDDSNCQSAHQAARNRSSRENSYSSVSKKKKYRNKKEEKSFDRLDSFSHDEEDNKGEVYDNDEDMSEISRTMISVAYLWSSLLFTSFIMTLAHDRVPDMKTYPPLPDIVLDNIPFIPWAFEMCEVCACALGIMWLLVLIFHKHRLILIRRMSALSGTIFLLRAFTMYVTSMSVPGVHLECNSTVYGSFQARFKRALEIFFGMGMALSGVRTCGDYMFSGHTSVVTLLNFLITEYTPRRWYFIHTFCWLLNAFAIFFILAAHEHYTIDVVIAFYISSRLFLYYHTLACSSIFNRSELKRTRIWFPLFWFFESSSKGRIPNEFEWPFSLESWKKLITSKANLNDGKLD